MSITNIDIKKQLQKTTNFLTNLKNKPFTQFFSYLLVSLVALGVDTLSLIFFTETVKSNIWVASSGAFLFGLLVNYFLSSIFVFRIKINLFTFFEFASVGLIGIVINSVGMAMLTINFGLYYLLAKYIMVAIVFLFNFLGRKYLFSK
jgi:putative flippase GtrA